MNKFKFRLGQKVIYNGEEVKIIAKMKKGGYIVKRKIGWEVNLGSMSWCTLSILKGTPMDGSIYGWAVDEKDLKEVSK